IGRPGIGTGGPEGITQNRTGAWRRDAKNSSGEVMNHRLYYTANTSVEIHEKLTEKQYREVEVMCAEPPCRYKNYADSYVFRLVGMVKAEQVMSYLRRQGL